MRTKAPIEINTVQDIFKYSRQELQAYCIWNDSNGTYNDDDDEFPDPTWQELFEIIANWIKEG